MSSSHLFQEYESQYCTVSTSVAHTLESLHTLSNNDIKVSKVKQIERQLKDVEPTLQRLDMEARSSPGPQSVVLVRKAKEYRKDWQKLMLDVKRVASDVSHDQVANRSELLHEYQTTSQQQRDRLLSATEQLQQTGDTIREGRKQLLETEVCIYFCCSVCDVMVFHVVLPFRKLGHALWTNCNVNDRQWNALGGITMMW